MMAESTETKLRQMLDREAIRDLAVRYCHCVWQKDIDGFLDLYAVDGIFRSSDPDWPQARGHAELRPFLEKMVEVEKPRPFVHNHVVELTGPDSGRGTSYAEVRISLQGEKGLLVGFYEDEYAKIDGHWKF